MREKTKKGSWVMYQNQQTNQDQYIQDIRMVKNENDLKAFIQKYKSDPRVQKAFQMTQGKNPSEYLSIAQNLGTSSGIAPNDSVFGEFRKFIGF